MPHPVAASTPLSPPSGRRWINTPGKKVNASHHSSESLLLSPPAACRPDAHTTLSFSPPGSVERPTLNCPTEAPSTVAGDLDGPVGPGGRRVHRQQATLLSTCSAPAAAPGQPVHSTSPPPRAVLRGSAAGRSEGKARISRGSEKPQNRASESPALIAVASSVAEHCAGAVAHTVEEAVAARLGAALDDCVAMRRRADSETARRRLAEQELQRLREQMRPSQRLRGRWSPASDARSSEPRSTRSDPTPPPIVSPPPPPSTSYVPPAPISPPGAGLPDVAELRRELAEPSEENGELRRAVASAEEELAAMRSAAAEAEAENATLRARCDELLTARDDLAALASRLQRELTEVTGDAGPAALLAAETERLRQELSAAGEEVRAAEAVSERCAELAAERDALQQQLLDSRKTCQQLRVKDALHETRSETARTELDLLRQQVEHEQSIAEELRRSNGELQVRAAAAEDQLCTLPHQVERAQTAAEELSSRNDELEARAAAAEEEVHSLRRQAERDQSAAEELRRDSSSFRARAAAAEDELQSLRDQVDGDLQCRAAAAAAEEEVYSLRQQVQRAAAAADELQSSNGVFQSRAAAAEEEARALRKELEAVTAEQSGAGAQQVTNSQMVIAQLEAARAVLEERLAAAEEDAQDRAAELRAAGDAAQELEERLDDARAEAREHAAKLREAEQKLAEEYSPPVQRGQLQQRAVAIEQQLFDMQRQCTEQMGRDAEQRRQLQSELSDARAKASAADARVRAAEEEAAAAKAELSEERGSVDGLRAELVYERCVVEQVLEERIEEIHRELRMLGPDQPHRPAPHEGTFLEGLGEEEADALPPQTDLQAIACGGFVGERASLSPLRPRPADAKSASPQTSPRWDDLAAAELWYFGQRSD